MKKIIHIDLDYFFAQVEEKVNPTLKNKPFAIGGKNIARGVISTCNYLAREYGVHSAMPTSVALKKCPHLILLPTDMEKYKLASKKIREVFYSITNLVEPLSLDEAYLDVTDVDICSNSGTLIAKLIKQNILKNTGLTASAGVAPNKLLAKIASDINKPDGLYVIPPKDVEKFIAITPVSRLFGVGKVTEQELNNMGVTRCKELQKYSQKELENRFGKFGLKLFEYCRGRDLRQLNPYRIRKSISVETTYINDLTNKNQCIEKIKILYEKLNMRILSEHRARISGLFVKLTDIKFNKISVERHSYNYELELFLFLFKDLYLKTNYPIRLLGLGVKLSEFENKQISLI